MGRLHIKHSKMLDGLLTAVGFNCSFVMLLVARFSVVPLSNPDRRNKGKKKGSTIASCRSSGFAAWAWSCSCIVADQAAKKARRLHVQAPRI
jgi:hypothetical protein